MSVKGPRNQGVEVNYALCQLSYTAHGRDRIRTCNLAVCMGSNSNYRKGPKNCRRSQEPSGQSVRELVPQPSPESNRDRPVFQTGSNSDLRKGPTKNILLSMS